MRRLLRLVLLGAALAGPARAEEEAWEAPDRLETFPEVGRAGFRFAVGGTRRDAVEDDLVLRAEFAAESAHGPGFVGRGAHDRAAGAWEAQGGLVARGPRFRALLGAGLLRWRAEAAVSIEGTLHVVPLAGLLAGAETRVHAGEPGPELAWSLHYTRGPWWAGLTLGSGAHQLRAAVGSAWLPGCSWFAAYRGGNPSVGIAVGAGPVELRAAETAHAALGGVSEVVVRWGRR
jgi:hypothetical protein